MKAMELFDAFNQKAFKDLNDPETKKFVDSTRIRFLEFDEVNRLEMLLLYMRKMRDKVKKNKAGKNEM